MAAIFTLVLVITWFVGHATPLKSWTASTKTTQYAYSRGFAVYRNDSFDPDCIYTFGGTSSNPNSEYFWACYRISSDSLEYLSISDATSL